MAKTLKEAIDDIINGDVEDKTPTVGVDEEDDLEDKKDDEISEEGDEDEDKIKVDPTISEETEEGDEEDKEHVTEEEGDEDEDKKEVTEEEDCDDDMMKVTSEEDDNWDEKDIMDEGDNAGLDDGDGGSKAQQKKQASPESGEKSDEISKKVTEMFEGAKVTPQFKKKASALFEAAVSEKATAARTKMKAHYQKKLKESVAKIEKRLDLYTNYVVENWLKQNRIAVEQGIRTEITENFMVGLKNLFTENYVEVPKDKFNLVADLEKTVKKLSEQLNSSQERFLRAQQVIRTMVKNDVFSRLSEGLSAGEVSKFKALTSDIKFVSEEAYAEKLSIIKKKHFGKVAKKLTMEETTTPTQGQVSDVMNAYLKTASKLEKKS